MPGYGAAPQLPTPSFGSPQGGGRFTNQQIGGAGAGLGALFGKMFGDYGNPSDAASPFFNKIPGTMTPYYDPYINAGRGALDKVQGQYGQLTGQLPGLQEAIAKMMGGQGGLQGEYGAGMGLGQGLRNQYGQMMKDPNAIINQLGKGYQESPGFKFSTDRATQAANAAAAAGGMTGSPASQQELAQQITGMANQDYGNYMNRALNMFGQGMQGQQGMYNQGMQGQQGMYNQGFGAGMGLYGKGLEGYGDINKMGYGASNELAQSLANALMSQGSLAYAGQANENQAEGDFWGNLLGGAASFAMPFML